jgi:hypothetical protein
MFAKFVWNFCFDYFGYECVLAFAAYECCVWFSFLLLYDNKVKLQCLDFLNGLLALLA